MKQELGGETSTNSQPKVLPSWLVAHNRPPEELQCRLPHLFRGLNISRSFEKWLSDGFDLLSSRYKPC